MSELRPLPARPDLAYEHKAAKAFLHRLRAGDPEALARARARHPAIDASAPDRIKLADAQLVRARDYGFTSWPRLVRWFGDVERQRHAPRRAQRREELDASMRALLAGHQRRGVLAGRAFAAFVPRFYGATLDAVFAATVTEADARLAVARQHGAPSWEVLLERTPAEPPSRSRALESDPGQQARRAIAAGDLDALRDLVDAHPELLRPAEPEESREHPLLADALRRERDGAPVGPIVDWLVARGCDLQRELNRQLCGHMQMKPETVRWLLDRGADASWVAPNGIPVLEHALVRYWNGAAVDLVAARTVPRKALWIAAGLGDVDGVRRALDGDGKPTPAARRLRPDFAAVGQPGFVPALPEADDEEVLLEAFVIAMLNGRVAVMEYMAARGFPLDTLAYGSPVINVAVGNAMVPAVECLVRCGANLDLKGWHPNQSARELARGYLEMAPQEPGRRRVAELCGLDPDAILAERAARPVPAPGVHPGLREALELAADDAFRDGAREVGVAHLLFGLLRSGSGALELLTQVSRLDLDRFRAEVGERVRPAAERVARPALQLGADAQAVLQQAIDVATARRRDLVLGFNLLHALLQDPVGPAAALVARHGGNPAAVAAELERGL